MNRDVVDVRHGEWKEIVTHNGCTPDYDCVCSLCGESGLPYKNYCSNCGAKMDGIPQKEGRGVMAIRCENCIHNGVCYLQEVTNDINKQLDEFGCEDYKSTADVVEVKRGKWLNIIFTQRYICSLCGNEIYFGKDKFCSECGAKMDGTSKERGGEK